MVKTNWLILLSSTLVPMVLGMVWYHPKVLGTAWMNAAGLDRDKLKGGNLPLIFGLMWVFTFFMSVALNFAVIHQLHVQSMLMSEPGYFEEGSPIRLFLMDTIQKYGQNFRTFKHGVFHGTILAFTLALPIISINALFERKSFTYVSIHFGYFLLSMALMGGIICAFP